jgi:uncharacterized membrane protein
MDEQKTEQPKVETKPGSSVTKKMSPENRRILMGVLAYVLFLIPLLTGDAKKDDFVKYHTKQGFALFIVSLALSIVSRILFPYAYIYPIISLIDLVTLVLFVIGIVNVANNKKEPLPIIGFIGDWLKI